MNHSRVFLILCLHFGVSAFSFVPPLSFVFKANFDGRKSVPVETVFRHQIQLKSGESMVIEEKLSEIGGRIYFVFRSPSYGDAGGTWTKGSYSFAGDKKISTRSRSFLSFYTASQGEQFRDVLVEEKFMKRDQFSQYKPSFTPQGDPAAWDLKENYIIQPQVYFSRTPQGPAIMAVGIQEDKMRRAVFFDKGTLLLSRLEWRDGNQEAAWNFRGNRRFSGEGNFPDELNFTLDNRTIIQSQLISRQILKGKAKNQWLDKFSVASRSGLNPNLEEGLRILLGYR